MRIALLFSQADTFLAKHEREVDAWAKHEQKRIASRVTDHRRGIGQVARRAGERLFYTHFAEDHVATLLRVRAWLDRPLLQGEIR